MSRWVLMLLVVGCVPKGTERFTIGEPDQTCDYVGCADTLIADHCLDCHSRALMDAERRGAPVGVDFDMESDLSRWSERMAVRVMAGTMPPGGTMAPADQAQLMSFLEGLQTCQPTCSMRDCGDDGCGGTCGTCGASLTCNTSVGLCVEQCTPDCTARTCGDDGCGGSCGSCGASEACEGGQCVCVPACDGRQCGDDGCGGTCGDCGEGECQGGQCVWPAADFANDVMPIFFAAGCGDGNCHVGPSARAALDLSNATTAHMEMVGVQSTQCADTMLVDPGNPGGSYLINKLTGQGMCAGEIMPRGGLALTPAEIDVVRAWIGGGAAQ